MGKTFTLRPPGQGPDPELAVGLLEPRKILGEWNDAERNALLRRGVFAPATYGRIRFHHRSTQEYLAAQWINQLLQKGCPRSKVFKVLFVEVYGVKTVVPSLRPVAAWLSLAHDDIRDEILNRDPLILIQHGDPGSLPVETRRRLLHAYAEKHEAGDIANDSLDHRALWMFAHPDLAETIRGVWDSCTRYDFRGDLLRLIREGAIGACADLVSKVAQDRDANIYDRIVAVQALNKCKNNEALSQVAENFLQEAALTKTKLASNFACELFPDYLNIDQLIYLIAHTLPPAEGSIDGFGYALKQLWEKCPSKWRTQFVAKVAKLALSKPFVDDYRRISNKYRFLAKNFEPIAYQLIAGLGDKEPNIELIRLLMAVERIDHSYSFQEDHPPLSELVQSHPKLHRSLFWADVEDVRENKDEEKSPIRHLQIFFEGSPLWDLGPSDLPWLYKDLDNHSLIDDKRIALSAIVSILQSEDTLEKEKTVLSEKLKPFPDLMEDLEGYLKPYKEKDWEREHRLHQKQSKKKQAERDKKAKASWIKFRNELIADPSQVITPEKCLWCIGNLTQWLENRTKQGPEKAPRQWRLIEKAFDQEVAYVYRDAMKALWRDINPERPRRKGNQITINWSTIYAYAGVSIEADENSRWAIQLTKEEAERAAKHGCMSEQGYPDWLDNLIDVHPDVVIPIVKKAFRTEWKSKSDGRSDFLYRYGNAAFPLNTSIAPVLFEIIVRSKPLTPNRLKYGLEILQRMELKKNQSKRLKKLAVTRLKHSIEQGEVEFALSYLALLFQVDQQAALQCLKGWLETADSETQTDIALQIFGVLFNRNNRGMIADSLHNSSVEVLKELVLVAFLYVHPNDDNVHDGGYTPDMRDNAERGRNSLLSALIDAKGVDAYDAMIELANTSEVAERSHRFRQLARGMAERDTESPPWTEDEIVTFENEHIAPIKNGDDLYRVVLAVLDDIRHQFAHGDASSKRLLSKLAVIDKDDEESVQNWLAEQLSLRTNGRYHVHRETEVANKDKPDIIVSGATAQVEVAIEVKQADSLSPNELKGALTQQLAEDYLKPHIRRHGVLFMTDHGRRQWKHPLTRKKLSFDGLLAFLSGVSNVTTKNSTGKVQVSVCGIDAT